MEYHQYYSLTYIFIAIIKVSGGLMFTMICQKDIDQ